MLTLRAHALIAGGLFAAILLLAGLGNALMSSGAIKNVVAFQMPARILFFGLTLAFGFSMIPVIVKLVLGAQIAFGNANVGPIKAAIEHQNWIIWTLWILIALGLAVALPAAIRDGFMDTSRADAPESSAAKAIARMPTQGTLVAAPGMSVDDAIRESSLKLRPGSSSPLTSEAALGGGAIFDFRVANTGIVFHRCRYYYMTTYTRDPRHIEAINVGTSASKMSRSELEKSNAQLRRRLKADGWLTGHEVYRTAEDQQLHGGRTRGEEGRLWLKHGTILDIQSRRLDDPAAGENVASAGEWIQYVDLRQHDDYPWIERYAFARPAE